MDVALELPFADGAYRFDLKLPQLFELQEKTGKGVFAIYAEIMAGRGFIGGEPVGNPFEALADYRCIREIILLGLIGGASLKAADFIAIEPVSHVNNAINMAAADPRLRLQDLGVELLEPGQTLSASMRITRTACPSGRFTSTNNSDKCSSNCSDRKSTRLNSSH